MKSAEYVVVNIHGTGLASMHRIRTSEHRASNLASPLSGGGAPFLTPRGGGYDSLHTAPPMQPPVLD